MYQNVLRIAKGVEADMFMFENVKGLFSKKYKGKTGAMYKHICEEFQEGKEGEIKYKLASTNKDTVLLKAIEYGVPQTRERLFLSSSSFRSPAMLKLSQGAPPVTKSTVSLLNLSFNIFLIKLISTLLISPYINNLLS